MSRTHALRWFSAATLVLLWLTPGPGYAQETGAASEIPARLRHLEGTVTVQRAAAGETEEAIINLPLGGGDRVWSAADGRVELMFEDGTTIWMDGGTTIDFVTLPRASESSGTILRLWTGSLFVERPGLAQGALAPLRLDTPTGAITFDVEGLFRVDMDDEQTVWLSAYDGSAVLDAGGIAERVAAGNRAVAQAGNAPSNAAAFNTSETDEFTSWREERFSAYATTRQYVQDREYVPQNIVHYAADLEPYGSWGYHATLGAWYWKPYAAVSWTPYRDGRWVYTYAGWSWVPGTSWGYVTTHYGRWHHGSGGWIWFPGRVWAPASVHWYVGSGHVGWVPLNYYNQPAVSFGVHIGGGGVGLSVGVSFGYNYGYPWYGWGGYRPYYGYGWGGYPPYYACCGHRRPWYKPGWKGGYQPPRGHYPSYRGDAYPIGSASGTGRVVRGLGYSSGTADAWTMVPSERFSSRNVGRVALGRSALPRDMAQQSKALVSGSLRARNPGGLVPAARRARPTDESRLGQSVPADRATGAVRTTTGTRARSDAGGAATRRATVRDNVSLGSTGSGAARTKTGIAAPPSSGAVRSTTGASGARRAVPTSSAGDNTATGAARSTNATVNRGVQTGTKGAAVRRSTATSPTLSRSNSLPRDRTGTASGATRQALSRSRSSGDSGTRYPAARSVTPSTRSSRPTVPTRSTPSVRSRTPGGTLSAPPERSARSRTSAPTLGSSPTNRSRPSVTPRSAGPTIRTSPSGPSRSTRSRPSGSVLPSSPSRPSGAVRRAPAVRPSGSTRPSGAIRPAGSTRPSGAVRRAGTLRPSGASRPAPSVRAPSVGRAPSVRPPAPARSAGGSSRTAVRRAKPKGGG
jgi:hypothetical protein